MESVLVTLEQFKKMEPKSQGFVSYYQAELPGSELKKHQRNPYPEGSDEYKEFAEGQMMAVLEAQDNED